MVVLNKYQLYQTQVICGKHIWHGISSHNVGGIPWRCR
ncbi:uncharacterized protein METZ01_LOCUS248212, partial [marine metagenome]